MAWSWKVMLEFEEFIGDLISSHTLIFSGRLPLVVFCNWQVKVKESGIKLAAKQKVAFLIPAEWRTIPATVLGKHLKIPGRICQFESQ
jgi:hypothetical protein